ncbi:hypothetical protein SAMN04487948_105383 [Halogranum amylolyticum]|uniref:SPW repeat-containing protein n=1 Tax=Halogranum amylolyticum TaxID=660520 RepID=A0A1H8SWH2_9EURY|nr:hypothetical protein [Halogranum amylolyticum]SEO83339.1 hypothetical protein SAMN04487948_105383 [Halogranum amylolyticum]
MSRLPSTTRSAITLLASALVATGSLSPWLASNSWLVALPGLQTGLDTWGALLLPAVLVVGALHGFASRVVSETATLVVGVLSLVAVAVYWQNAAVGGYVPAVGWYLTAVGGLLLVGVGVERFWSRFGYRLSGTDDPRSV